MKYFFLAISLSLIIVTAIAQKKSNLFLAGELSDNSGASLIYNYGIHGKYGIGAGFEVFDFGTISEGSFSALADFRYYHTIGKSSIIPLLQVGKYMYDYEATIFSNHISIKGSTHFAIGLAYSYGLFKNGGGLFGAFKYRNVSLETTTNNSKQTNSDGNIVFSIGIRL